MSIQADYQAIIFDMDGVLTDTRKLHFISWKKTFDNYLVGKGLNNQFTVQDYNSYVDGKIRSDGIIAYLESIGVHPDADQVKDLGILKNTNFQELILSDSLAPFEEVVSVLKGLHDSGIKIGVVSSSENCRAILARLNLNSLVDVILDGSDGKRLNLRGKPQNDYYLTMLNLLNVDAHFCALVEDSISGVSAGKNSKLTVFGMSRDNQTSPERLIEAGADYIISDLSHIGEIPNAIKSWNQILLKLKSKEPALFLDFDGTISDIVSHPEDAILVRGMKDILVACARSLKLAIISGRERTDVKSRVDIEDIFYAGCHGLDISGPGCFHYSFEKADEFLSSLEKFNLGIGSLLLGIQGLVLERKQYCTSIHYRMANERDERLIKERVKETILGFPALKIREGKKVYEILPNIDWGKDKAIKKLVEVLNLNLTKSIPVFIGDDTTDEESFLGLKDYCLCIRVTKSENMKTHAHYVLADPNEVTQFISLIRTNFTGIEKRWRTGS